MRTIFLARLAAVFAGKNLVAIQGIKSLAATATLNSRATGELRITSLASTKQIIKHRSQISFGVPEIVVQPASRRLAYEEFENLAVQNNKVDLTSFDINQIHEHLSNRPDGYSFAASEFRGPSLNSQSSQYLGNFFVPDIIADRIMKYASKRLIVRLLDRKSDAKAGTMSLVGNMAHIAVITELSELPFLFIDLAPNSTHADVKHVAELMLMDKNVEYIEADMLISISDDKVDHISKANEIADDTLIDDFPAAAENNPPFLSLVDAPNDPLFPQQWSLPWSGITKSWLHFDWSRNDVPKPTVCIIDTGIDYNHPDIKGSLWTNQAELYGQPGVDDDGNGVIDDIYGYNAIEHSGDPLDDSSHGTHCAGIIGATTNNNLGIAGVHKNVKLMGCKFLDAQGTGSVSNAVKCIGYAMKMGAEILSNSWGGGGSRALNEAVGISRRKGLVFVVAAGNSRQNIDLLPTYPASYTQDNMIRVASVDQNGLSSFSNYGVRTVDVGAPGSGILSSVRNGKYAIYSGTSMACPAVSGLVALIKSASPNLDYNGIKAAIEQSIRPFSNIDVKWRGVPRFDLAIQNVKGPSWYRPLHSWPAYFDPYVIKPNTTLSIPFSFYAYEYGKKSSNFTIRFKSEDNSIREEVTLPISLKV